MRVLNSAKWFSCLAASGGLMLILSGQALASDEGSGVKTEADQSAAVSVSQEHIASSSGDAVVIVSQTSQTVQAAGATPAAAILPEPAAEPASIPAATPVVNSPTEPATVTVQANDPAAQPAEGEGVLAGISAPRAASVSFRDVRPLQPVVTSVHAMPVNDLAAIMPTAAAPAAPDKAPVPAQPTGLLGQLSAQLAGSVVKPVYLPEVSGAGTAASFTLMIFLMILTVRVVAAAFGFSTRRDGYAHAARSDVAAASNLIFATPFSLSYVTATRQHVTHF